MAYDVFSGKKVPGDWSCGISIEIEEKQKRELLAKMDSVRSDVRKTGGMLRTGMLAIAAAIGLVAVAKMTR